MSDVRGMTGRATGVAWLDERRDEQRTGRAAGGGG